MSGEGPVRLAMSSFGGRLQCAVAEGTLSHKAVVAYDEAKAMGVARELVSVLARGNRARTLTAQALAELRGAGEELWRSLVPGEVREDLAAREGQAILLELDESLVAIPWELLHDGKEFLCRRFELGRSVATPQPRRAPSARRMGSPARMLVLCSDPRGDLPAVAEEGRAITLEMDTHPGVLTRVVNGKDADFVRKTVKDYDMVHYAGHAEYVPGDPEASGWLLSGGKLSARDVVGLAGGRPMPMLVFANACQSSHEGSWSGEDPGRVFGLANAFLLAGVRFYLGTQWEIVDAQSHTFARSFYAELARGRSVGAAVKRARDAVIVAEGEGGMGWASYVLYGDPSYVPLAASQARKAVPLPTPADLVARESIKGVVKVRSSKRDDVSGEVALVPARVGSTVKTLHAEAPRDDAGKSTAPTVSEGGMVAGTRGLPVGVWIAVVVGLVAAAVIVARLV